jgi:hypothetical protein
VESELRNFSNLEFLLYRLIHFSASGHSNRPGSEMAAAETSGAAIGAPGRWALHGKTALVTGGTRGIGYGFHQHQSNLCSIKAPTMIARVLAGVRWWRSWRLWGQPCIPAPGRRQNWASASRSGRPGGSVLPAPSPTSLCGTSGSACFARSPIVSAASSISS